MPQSNTHQSPWSGLVISILSVNHFPVERTVALLPQLQSEKLTDPEELSMRTAPEIYAKLVNAGYDRGDFLTHLFAERLVSLGVFAKEHGIAACEPVMNGTDEKAIENLLLPIKGIGPTVLRNFRLLKNI